MVKFWKPIYAIFGLIFVSLLSSISFAGNIGIEGFNVQRFVPNFDGLGIYNVQGSNVLPHLKYSTGFTANLSRDSARIYMPARNSALKAVDDNLTMDFNAAMGLADFMEVGIGIPFTPIQTGTNYNNLQGYTASSVGDVRLDVKFEAFRDKPKSIGLSFLSEASFPTGNRSAFTGNDGVTWEGKAIIGKSFEPVSLYANAGYKFIKAVKVLSTTYDDTLTFGGGVTVRLPFDEKSWILKTEVTGETVASNMNSDLTPVEVRGGVRKEFKSGIALDVGGGRGITRAIGSPSFRVFAGLSFDSAARARKKSMHKINVGGKRLDHKVKFGFDKYRVANAELPELLDVAVEILRMPNARIIVEGYSDNIGTKHYNMKLGAKRAGSVKAALVKAGVPADRIETVSFGEENPAVPNSTAEERKQNRRVEIHAVHESVVP